MSETSPSSRTPARPELLAPAGDWDCVKAAVENGADAIYFGLERFNARMRAKNFTTADLPRLMEYLHRRGVKGYVTFNVLVFTQELQAAEDYLRSIIAAGVDAAIVQDVGISRLIRKLSPDFPLHGSTQMTVTSAAGVEFARDLGADLVVLARENSIAEIEKIQTAQAALGGQLPLEVFIHGALCVAYSGQCLTSESLGGRSANRGECAQACRLPYDLYADGQKVELGDRRYLLSPQDLAGLDVLPDLVRAGVASLKIEGRLKSPEYVASITRVYRQALDKLLPPLGRRAGEDASLSAEEARYQLEMTFSRGLYTGWFRGIQNQELAHGRFGTKRGVHLGTVERVQNGEVAVRLEAPTKAGDGVVFDAGNPEAREEGGRIYTLREQSGLTWLSFGSGDIDFRKVRTGQRIWKTSDPELERRIRQTFAGDKPRFQRPLRAEVHGRAGGPLSLILDDGEGHVVRVESVAPLQEAQNQPLTAERLREQVGRLGGTPFTLGLLESHLEGAVILPLSDINQVRREAVAQLDALRAAPKRWTLNTEPVVAASLPLRAPLREAPAAPEVIAVVRDVPQLRAILADDQVRTVYCEFENPKHYREAVELFKAWRAEKTERSEATIWVAAPRITKPGEEWILKQVRSSEADGYLVRNHDHLSFFAGDRKRGDFSLNIANPLSAAYLLEHYNLERVTASYDLNVAQLEALLSSAPPAWFDITLHQHMPMFHMEHCVFCAFLSEGRDYRDCGRPCEKHRVHLKDRVGAEFPLRADAGCRNTVYNNRAQTGAEFVDRLLALGARSFRVEFINETPAEAATTVRRYTQLLRGEVSGTDLWKELRALNQLGVTRGQLESAPQLIHRKV